MSKPRALPSLAEIIPEIPPVHIVDIGATPLDGEPPPYARLLKDGFAWVVGFEPDPDGLAELNRKKGPHETYLPYAIGDGQTHQFKVCRAPGMSSFLEPNHDLLSYFHGFPNWGTVVRRMPVATVRLDDVSEIENIDFLKIDIQGAELMVFEHAQKRLANCLVIQTEVEFLPMYEGQPLFSEVELFLRRHGFLIHKFDPLKSRAIQPMIVNNDIYAGFSQIFWADAVFVRDFTRLQVLSPEQLLKLALVMHDVYGSHDIVLRALMEYDRRSNDSKHAERFMESFKDRVSP